AAESPPSSDPPSSLMPPPSLAPPSSLAPPLSLDSVVEKSPPEPSSDSSDGPPHPTAPSARTPLVATRAHRCQAVRPVFIVLTSRRAPSSDRSASAGPLHGCATPAGVRRRSRPPICAVRLRLLPRGEKARGGSGRATQRCGATTPTTEWSTSPDPVRRGPRSRRPSRAPGQGAV